MEKGKLEERAKEKKELHESVLPSKAQKLLGEIRETSKIIGTPMEEERPESRSHKIRDLLDMLQPLNTRGRIEIAYSGEEECEEVEVTVMVNKDCEYYAQAQQNDLNIQQRTFRISIVDVSPQHSELLIGVDRREEFTNEEVFQGLIGQHAIRVPFSNPTSEGQRNLNAKYVYADWLSQLTDPFLLTPQDFINHLRSRIFTLQLISYLRDNSKKLNYFFPLPRGATMPQNFKK